MGASLTLPLNLNVVVVVCLLLAGSVSSSSQLSVCHSLSKNATQAQNEDFSSCSYFTVGKRLFECKRDVEGLDKFIFASRVNDGICDCCDGSDEVTTKCPNRCENELVQAKRMALMWHRNVQSGRHKRQELLNELDRRRRRETDKFSHLEQQLVDLDKMRLKMKFHLQREVRRENRERLRLLRERLANCILGFYESCNFFAPGFLNEDELKDYDLPNASALKKRPRLKNKNLAADITYMNELSGPARVRSSLCLEEQILRDDTNKISVTTGEYLAFMDTAQGENSLTTPEHRRVYFAQYLDEGDYGFMMAGIAIGELASLIVLPVTAVGYLLEYLHQYGSQAAWDAILQCAFPKSEAPMLLHSACVALTSENLWAIGSFISLYLDPTSYSIFASMWDQVQPYATWPLRISLLLWFAPKLYYEYYFGNSADNLPPRRICCLLRSGLDIGLQESHKLSARLKEEMDIREALKQQDIASSSADVDSNLAATAPEDEKEKDKARQKVKSSRSRNTKAAVLIDYGPLKEWEAVKGVCLENAFGAYTYKFCYFKEIRQGTTMLGKFTDWGVLPRNELEEEATTARKSTKRGRDKRKTAQLVETTWLGDSLDAVGLGVGDGAATNAIKKDDAYYSKQQYRNGARCIGQKKSRAVQVTFHCSPDHNIVDVVESEICFYDMSIATPMACTDHKDAESLAKLGALGVFGYT